MRHVAFGEGEPGIALYRGERKIKPKGILLIDSLIELPFEDRRLVGAYASRMAAEVEAYEPPATKANEIRMFVDELIAELGGFASNGSDRGHGAGYQIVRQMAFADTAP